MLQKQEATLRGRISRGGRFDQVFRKSGNFVIPLLKNPKAQYLQSVKEMHQSDHRTPTVAVVIPAYRARCTVLDVIQRVGPAVSLIYVIDDGCPEETGRVVERDCSDSRVQVLKNKLNLGVGAAMKRGYEAALNDGADIIVKIDADGQCRPELIPELIYLICVGASDYVKGNRLLSPESLKTMPKNRLFGNLVLSFATKISSGYWHLMDPTNGLTAISANIWTLLPAEKISDRFFFESDMLFRLGLLGARVHDFSMVAVYGEERSSLVIKDIIWPFLWGLAKNSAKRIVYKYFVQDFNIGSLYLISGLSSLVLGGLLGISYWAEGVSSDQYASPGRVMLAGLPVLLGFQLLFNFLAFDMAGDNGRRIHFYRSK